jgi:outer membrane protein assembly factor BamB
MRCILVRALLLAAPVLVFTTGAGESSDKVENERTDVKKAAQEWLLFRGNPLQTGVATAHLPEKLQTLWSVHTGDSIESAPAVADGVVYVGSMDEHLYAFDLKTGQEKWKYKGGPFKAPPSVHDGKVYIGDSDGLFHCVNAAKGTKAWTFETGGEITSGANFSDGLILFGSYDETLYCLNRDGKEKWKFKTQGPVNGSPSVAQGRTFVAGCDSSVHVIDVARGKELLAVNLNGQAAATAAVVGDHLYVGTMTNEVHAIDWKKGQVDWSFQAQPENRPQPFYASAAVSGDLVVVGSRDKRIYALDRNSGKEVWSFSTKGRVDASPVIVGKRVYAGSLDGKLYVLDLASGQEFQKITLDGPISGSPAVVEGRLLVGTQKGTVYCLGEKR